MRRTRAGRSGRWRRRQRFSQALSDALNPPFYCERPQPPGPGGRAFQPTVGLARSCAIGLRRSRQAVAAAAANKPIRNPPTAK